ncbi:unnamed protein product [Symbiodinium sp. CCMP2592]|nr:unnamed protein product [Symbiodinium sp. CCMP2592]
MHLAGAETLHQAHVLLEMDKSLMCGARVARRRADRTWSKHLLGAVDSPAVNTVLAHVTRLEFQDGRRKRARQHYHGRGTTHSHSLDYLENKAAIGLENKISAHLPSRDEDPLLHGLVLDGQRDYTDSGVEVREDPSVWDASADLARLQHTAEDKELHLRPYFPQTLGITKCHEDVQQGNGNGAVLRYVASYAPKFSDSMDQEWLNDQASDYSVARRILFSYHPLEPEMWLTLAQERFPQIAYSGSMLNLMTPSLDCTAKPQLLKNYEASDWRRDDMCFLEYLRKSNATGEIIRHIREAHKREVLRLVAMSLQAGGRSAKQAQQGAADFLKDHKAHAGAAEADFEEFTPLAVFAAQKHGVAAPSLEEFANDYQCRGEKLIAAGMNSMLHDKYYGQWLVLHRPFRHLEDLQAMHPDIREKVPLHYQQFALALRHAPDFWENDRAIEAQMELEAQSRAHVATILGKVRAQRHLVERALAGDLEQCDDADISDADPAVAPLPIEQRRFRLTQSQRRLNAELEARLDIALAASQASTDEEYEDAVVAARGKPMLLAHGAPGTGKTFAVHEQIRRGVARGARILFALPTGYLAAAMRAKHPDIDVDTFHGGLLFHKDLSEAMGVLTQYDLVILDEVSMLTAAQFERLLEMWRAAERLPCLVMLGDFWQLPTVDPKEPRCDESSCWRANVQVVQFYEQVRCKDACLQRKLDCLRTSVPSKQQLKHILRRRRAWKTSKPTAWDVPQLLRTKSDTTVVTCTRSASALFNKLAAKVLFHDRRKRPLGNIPMDYDANDDNFEGRGQLRKGPLSPSHTDVFRGERILLTKNLDKRLLSVPARTAGRPDRQQILRRILTVSLLFEVACPDNVLKLLCIAVVQERTALTACLGVSIASTSVSAAANLAPGPWVAACISHPLGGIGGYVLAHCQALLSHHATCPRFRAQLERGMGRGKAKWNRYDQEGGDGPGGSTPYWRGAYSPSQRPWKQPGEGDSTPRPRFPTYQSMQVKDSEAGSSRRAAKGAAKGNAQPTEDPEPGSVMGVQPVLNLARKAELKVQRLLASRDKAHKQWAVYDEELKQTFLREKRKFTANMQRLDTELSEALKAQDLARQAVYQTVAGHAVPKADANQEEAMDWDRTREAWEQDDGSDLNGVLSRALAHAGASDGLSRLPSLHGRPQNMPPQTPAEPVGPNVAAPAFGGGLPSDPFSVPAGMQAQILRMADEMRAASAVAGRTNYTEAAMVDPYQTSPGGAYLKAPAPSVSPPARVGPYDGPRQSDAKDDAGDAPSLEERVAQKRTSGARSAMRPFGLPPETPPPAPGFATINGGPMQIPIASDDELAGSTPAAWFPTHAASTQLPRMFMGSLLDWMWPDAIAAPPGGWPWLRGEGRPDSLPPEVFPRVMPVAATTSHAGLKAHVVSPFFVPESLDLELQRPCDIRDLERRVARHVSTLNLAFSNAIVTASVQPWPSCAVLLVYPEWTSFAGLSAVVLDLTSMQPQRQGPLTACFVTRPTSRQEMLREAGLFSTPEGCRFFVGENLRPIDHDDPEVQIGESPPPLIRPPRALMLLHHSGRFFFGRHDPSSGPVDAAVAAFVGVERASVSFHAPPDGLLEHLAYRGSNLRSVIALVEKNPDGSQDFVVLLDLRQVAGSPQFVRLGRPYLTYEELQGLSPTAPPAGWRLVVQGGRQRSGCVKVCTGEVLTFGFLPIDTIEPDFGNLSSSTPDPGDSGDEGENPDETTEEEQATDDVSTRSRSRENRGPRPSSSDRSFEGTILDKRAASQSRPLEKVISLCWVAKHALGFVSRHFRPSQSRLCLIDTPSLGCLQGVLGAIELCTACAEKSHRVPGTNAAGRPILGDVVTRHLAGYLPRGLGDRSPDRPEAPELAHPRPVAAQLPPMPLFFHGMFVVMTPGYKPDCSVLALRAPCTLEFAIQEVQSVRPRIERLRPWSGKLFVAQVPDTLTREELLTAAGCGAGVLLEQMLQSVAMWNERAELPFSYAPAIWLLTDTTSVRLDIEDAHAPIRSSVVAEALSCDPMRIVLRPVAPPINDHDAWGWGMFAVVIATTRIPRRRDPDAVPLAVAFDQRPILQGIDWSLEQDRFLLVQDLADRYAHLCPEGMHVAFSGADSVATSEGAAFALRDGLCLTVDFVFINRLRDDDSTSESSSGSTTSTATASSGDSDADDSSDSGRGERRSRSPRGAPVPGGGAAFVGDGPRRTAPSGGGPDSQAPPSKFPASLSFLRPAGAPCEGRLGFDWPYQRSHWNSVDGLASPEDAFSESDVSDEEDVMCDIAISSIDAGVLPGVVVTCLDLWHWDGRVFAAVLPPDATADDILNAAAVVGPARPALFVGNRATPVAADEVLHIVTGTTITFMPSTAPAPVLFSLGGQLESHLPWGTGPAFPLAVVDDWYHLRYGGQSRLFRLQADRGASYRRDVSELLSLDLRRLRLAPSTMALQIAFLRQLMGIAYSTVERSLEAGPRFHVRPAGCALPLLSSASKGWYRLRGSSPPHRLLVPTPRHLRSPAKFSVSHCNEDVTRAHGSRAKSLMMRPTLKLMMFQELGSQELPPLDPVRPKTCRPMFHRTLGTLAGSVLCGADTNSAVSLSGGPRCWPNAAQPPLRLTVQLALLVFVLQPTCSVSVGDASYKVECPSSYGLPDEAAPRAVTAASANSASVWPTVRPLPTPCRGSSGFGFPKFDPPAPTQNKRGQVDLNVDCPEYGTLGFLVTLLEESVRPAAPGCIRASGPSPMMTAVWLPVLSFATSKDVSKLVASRSLAADLTSGDLHCFTDGSVPSCFLSTCGASAFVAECCALIAALWITTCRCDTAPIIFGVDCTAALGIAEGTMLSAGSGTASVLFRIGSFARSLCPCTRTFCHSPGHRCILANELAALAARRAAQGHAVGEFSWTPASTHDWWASGGVSLDWAGVALLCAAGHSTMPMLGPGAVLPSACTAGMTPTQLLEPFCPTQTGDNRSVQRGTLRLIVGTYNVLSLCGQSFGDNGPCGLAFVAGRPHLLAACLKAANVDVLAVQEARTEQGTVVTDSFLRFCSGASKGNFGTELWFRQGATVVASTGSRVQPVRFLRKHFIVLHSDPRRLIVLFHDGATKLVFTSLHGPHKGSEAALLEAWWKETGRLLEGSCSRGDLIVMGDFNADLGIIESAAVGPHAASAQDFAGEQLHALARHFDLWLPSTWPDVHPGPSGTYVQKRNGATSRLDYVCLPQSWRSSQVSSWVDPTIHAGQPVVDHIAVLASVTAVLSFSAGARQSATPRLDVQAMLAPEGRKRIADILGRAPAIPWSVCPDAHAAQLVAYVQRELRAAFPKPCVVRRHAYLTDATWACHTAVARLRRQLTNLRRAICFHSVAAAFSTWRDGGRTLAMTFGQSRWMQQARAQEVNLGAELQSAARALRLGCKADRAAHLSSLADTVGEGQDASFHALRQLLGHRRRKPFAPEVLPQLLNNQGELCDTPASTMDRWRQHFSDMEAGTVASLEQIASLSRPPQLSVSSIPRADFPAPADVLAAILTAKKGKASGPDGVPVEFGHACPAQWQQLLLPLLLKVGLHCQEPIGLKSGILTWLYKGRGSKLECSSYRAIMLLSTVAKTLHRAFRPALYRFFDNRSLPVQIGGKKSTSVLFGAHLSRSFLSWRASLSMSGAILFADVAAAYYSAVRALTARDPTDTTEAANPQPPELQDQLAAPSALRAGGAGPWLETMTHDFNHHTWMTLAGDDRQIITTKGSRPGSSWADLFFGVTVPGILALRDQLRAEASGCSPEPPAHVLWDGVRAFCPSIRPAIATPLTEVVWADDVASYLCIRDPAEVARRLGIEASTLIDAFAGFGYTLSFGPGKTAAVVALRGPGARHARRSVFSSKAVVPVLSENRQGELLPLVAVYKHLGVKIEAAGSLLPEIKQRVAQAWIAFREGRTKVFRSKRLTPSRKGCLLRTLVMSRLTFGSGAWRTLRVGEYQAFSRCIVALYRQCLGIPHDGDQEVTTEAICSLLQQPDPLTILRVERLRYARQLVATGPDVLWALLKQDPAFTGAIQDACGWLFRWVSGTSTLGDPNVDWDSWVRVMVDRPRLFRGLVKRGRGLECLRLGAFAAFQAVRKALCIVGCAARQAPNAVDDAVEFKHACLLCRIAFASRAAWAVHAAKCHGYRAPATLLAREQSTPLCAGCGRLYANHQRLRRHLLHSTACRTQWGAFQCADVPSALPHVQRPPCQVAGHLGEDPGLLDSAAVHPGLLEALLGLQTLDSESIWATVLDFVEPLDVLRNTLTAWTQHERAQNGCTELAADAALLLDPELWCEDFRVPLLVRAHWS